MPEEPMELYEIPPSKESWEITALNLRIENDARRIEELKVHAEAMHKAYAAAHNWSVHAKMNAERYEYLREGSDDLIVVRADPGGYDVELHGDALDREIDSRLNERK